jgi:hypothetical protein
LGSVIFFYLVYFEDVHLRSLKGKS